MEKYLKVFNEHDDYEDFIESGNFVRPNVTYCVDEEHIHYNDLSGGEKLVWKHLGPSLPGGMLQYDLVTPDNKQVIVKDSNYDWDRYYIIDYNNYRLSELNIECTVSDSLTGYSDYIVINSSKSEFVDTGLDIYFIYDGIEYKVHLDTTDNNHDEDYSYYSQNDYISPELEI